MKSCENQGISLVLANVDKIWLKSIVLKLWLFNVISVELKYLVQLIQKESIRLNRFLQKYLPTNVIII